MGTGKISLLWCLSSDMEIQFCLCKGKEPMSRGNWGISNQSPLLRLERDLCRVLYSEEEKWDCFREKMRIRTQQGWGNWEEIGGGGRQACKFHVPALSGGLWYQILFSVIPLTRQKKSMQVIYFLVVIMSSTKIPHKGVSFSFLENKRKVPNNWGKYH